MKRTGYVLLAVVFSSSWLVTGCRRPADEAEPDDPAVQPVPVRAAQARVTTLRPSIDLIGAIVPIPERTSEVSTQVAGQIERVAVIEGQSVQAGDVLIQVDPRPGEARLAGARATEQRAGATLAKLEHGPRPEEVEAARQTARQLAAVTQSLGAKLDALRSLHEKGDVSDVEFGQAQARFDAAEAESLAAEARLRLLEIGTRPEEIAEARAELAAAQADVAAAELEVEFCTIRSSIRGVVVQLSVRAGASVAPADVLATVVDTSELFVQARLPSAHFSEVKRGAHADVWIEPDVTTAMPGSVARLGSQANPDTGDVDILVSIHNDSGTWVPGLACRLRVWLPELGDALAIPVAAVADRDGTPVVTVIREGRAYEQPVRLGVNAGDLVQVIEGLNEGDWIATEGGYGLPEGCPVRVIPEESQPSPDARPEG
jgi:multidrug efflux pump subunit AcrA (membrane-fusion protein)